MRLKKAKKELLEHLSSLYLDIQVSGINDPQYNADNYLAVPVDDLRNMVLAIQRHNKYQANIASFTNARAAMLHVASKSKLSVKDFLPFPDEIESQGGVMQFRTVETLRRLIKNHALPPRVEMSARKALGGMADG